MALYILSMEETDGDRGYYWFDNTEWYEWQSSPFRSAPASLQEVYDRQYDDPDPIEQYEHSTCQALCDALDENYIGNSLSALTLWLAGRPVTAELHGTYF